MVEKGTQVRRPREKGYHVRCRNWAQRRRLEKKVVWRENRSSKIAGCGAKEAKIAVGRTQGKRDDEDGGCLINGRE